MRGVISAWLALALCFTAPALAQEDQREQALELYEQGKAAYRDGRLADSISLIEEAYALYPEPVLLYNLARAYEAMGNFEKAIDAYERYLGAEKEVPDRGAIEQKVVTLKKALEDRHALVTEPAAPKPTGPAPAAPDHTAPTEPSAWPWVLAGLGAGGVVAGAVVGALALSRNEDAETAASQLETAELRSEAESLATGATVAFIVGGAILASGMIWGIVDIAASGPAESAAALSIRVGPGGGVIVFRH